MIDFQSMPLFYPQSDKTQLENSVMPILSVGTVLYMENQHRTEFGARLFKARKHAKLTQDQLSQAVGMTQPVLSALEWQGQSSQFTPAIADRCGVSTHWLAYGAGEMLEPSKAVSGLSHEAFELASLYDLIPITDRIKRAVAHADAAQAILAVLQDAPSTAHTPERRKKRFV